LPAGGEYDFLVQVQITLLVVALFALGTMIPRIDQRPWQGDFLLITDSKQPIKMVSRIWASWRIERLNLKKRVLTQHFDVHPK
jgi:hypothetical protein